MAKGTSRRQFLQGSTAAAVGYWVAGGVAARASNSPNERIAMASIGIDGKGKSDSGDAAKQGDMLAICDVDSARLARSAAKYPRAKAYTDFRKMLDEMQDSIDAVTVSTPDHTHAPASLLAIRLGKHCFCQKPLARTIYEARLMGTVARQMKVATQMGNQGTADSGLRQQAGWLRAGVLGQVSEVHVWTNRPIWPQGIPRPKPASCPDHLDWNLWLGTAPKRPYADGYHPFKWRGWWDFGTGALGDMACHNINMPFMGLDLRNPVWVEAETSGHNGDSFPSWSIVTYQFAATDARPALKLFWYEGGKTPGEELLDGQAIGKSGSLTIGSKGKLLNGKLLGGAEPVEVEYPRSPGHFEEWVRAIRGGEPAMSNFPDYAGPLTETVLLGNLAIWTGQRVQWDAAKMQAKNVTGVETLIKPVYRDGYTLDV